MQVEIVDSPKHYDKASALGRRFLLSLGVPKESLELPCYLALESLGWDKDAYLYLTGKHLWRLGEKNERHIDAGKASWYLARWVRLNPFDERRGAALAVLIRLYWLQAAA